MFLNDQSSIAQRTQTAFIWMRLMGTPCWCLLSMLAFILYKNVHLTPLQIAVIVALKPASSLFSPYWSQAIYQRPDKIVGNLMGANFFRHLPFLFIPWVHSSWFIIIAFGFYMMLTRATIPAWMEIFKHNLPEKKREQVVGYGTVIDYLGTAVLVVGVGILLDNYRDVWRWLFLITASVGILSTFFLTSIAPHLSTPKTSSTDSSSHHKVYPNNLKNWNFDCAKAPGLIDRKQPHISNIGLFTIDQSRKLSRQPKSNSSGCFGITEKVLKPWKHVWQLICERKDFAIFQIGFMMGGAGLMIMQPALPQFFIDILHLSFVEMGLAISLCKGIGVALTSSLWAKLFRQFNIFQLSALVTFFATLFPFLLLATSFHLALLYLAYAFYGVMQAGSELSWHMSGLVFAQEKDSSTFSATNVLTVGIRGCIIPAVGSILLPFIQPLGVILFGALLCLCASSYFLFNSRMVISERKPVDF